MADTPGYQGGVTDFLSWPPLVGACGIVVPAGASLPRSAGYGLKEDACLTGETKMGYYRPSAPGAQKAQDGA